MLLRFTRKVNHRGVKFLSVDSHQFTILFRIDGVEAYRYRVNDSMKLWRDVTFVDKASVPIGVQTDFTAVRLHPCADFLHRIETDRRLAVPAENNFVIELRIFDFFYHFGYSRLSGDLQIMSLHDSLPFPVAEYAVGIATDRQINIEGL